MTTPHVPAIPVQLADRPVLAGLVIPWTTARTPDGRYRFGDVDLDRQNQAMTEHLCQTCGRPLDERIVFALRDSDLRALTSHEPGMHPVCAAYAATACPMIGGRMDHYRSASPTTQLADPRIAVYGDPAHARAGAAAEVWQLVWVTGYRVYTHPHTQLLAAMLLPQQIRRVRPVTSSIADTEGERR